MMNTARFRRSLAALLAALSLAACYAPAPETKIRLDIAADGRWTMAGKVVTADELHALLAARAAPRLTLILEIHPSPQAKVESIQAAVATAKRSETSVAFVNDEAR